MSLRGIQIHDQCKPMCSLCSIESSRAGELLAHELARDFAGPLYPLVRHILAGKNKTSDEQVDLVPCALTQRTSDRPPTIAAQHHHLLHRKSIQIIHLPDMLMGGCSTYHDRPQFSIGSGSPEFFPAFSGNVPNLTT